MYLGRIVAIGMTKSGRACAMYRVSSRSFPNRQAVENNGKIAIVPRPGAEGDLAKNPYISYNCLRIAGEWAVATNGSQTDPITEKIASGMPVRDAITLGLLAMDYEKDSLDTPRIVAVAGRVSKLGYLGIIRKDAVLVWSFRWSRAWPATFRPMKRTGPAMRMSIPTSTAPARTARRITSSAAGCSRISRTR